MLSNINELKLKVMNKKILILLSLPIVALITSQRVFAQQYPAAPDNEAIELATMDSGSPYYYPALFMRYTSGDMSLDIEDYRHLYYGYAYRASYKPLETSPSGDRILTILGSKPELDEQDYKDIISFAEEVFRAEPFNPGTINFLTYAYGMLGDTINERINANRLEMILETIASSGTGLTEDSPWHVLYFSHPIDVFAAKELLMRKRIVISRNVEFVSLLEPQGRLKGYYFDYGRVYWNKPEEYKGKTSNGLQFNGTTIKERK